MSIRARLQCWIIGAGPRIRSFRDQYSTNRRPAKPRFPDASARDFVKEITTDDGRAYIANIVEDQPRARDKQFPFVKFAHHTPRICPTL